MYFNLEVGIVRTPDAQCTQQFLHRILMKGKRFLRRTDQGTRKVQGLIPAVHYTGAHFLVACPTCTTQELCKALLDAAAAAGERGPVGAALGISCTPCYATNSLKTTLPRVYVDLYPTLRVQLNICVRTQY